MIKMVFRIFKMIVLGMTLLCSHVAGARVFSFTDSWVAGYINGTGGLSQVGNDAFKDTSGNNTSFRNRDSVDYNFSGEVGFVFILNPKFEIQTGIEGIQSKDISASGYLTPASTPFMSVDSRVTIFNPNVKFGYYLTTFNSARWRVYAGIGYATIKVTNDYTQTSAPYGGPLTYKENWNASAIAYDAGTSFEFFLFDNATLSLSAGWRMIESDSFKYSANLTGIRGGSSTAFVKGASVLDNNNQKVNLDMGGPYAGITFRFYIPPLD